METNKPTGIKTNIIRLFLFCLFIIFIRSAYIVTLKGDSCDDVTGFCFFSPNLNLVTSIPKIGSSAIISETTFGKKTKSSRISLNSKLVKFYSALFQDLVGDQILSKNDKVLCLEFMKERDDVFALKELGFRNVVFGAKMGILSFGNETYDFVFLGSFDKFSRKGLLAGEVTRVLKKGGVLVIHTRSKDEYSYNSLIRLFDSFEFVASRDVKVFEEKVENSYIHQVVTRKVKNGKKSKKVEVFNGKCSVPGFKREIVKKAEPLIVEEPLKPWLTLKKNIQNVKYFTNLVDINFKERYVYVDVGARSYGSSIGGWFKKQYPKQNRTFDVYAIEADKAFYEEYKSKKAVTLLPYAAWVKNETLFFEVSHGKEESDVAKGKGMGRIKPKGDSKGISTGVELEGFDFADWLKRTVTEKDFVVMKMDVEGTEFDLIPRLFETGAICLIDEIFLECHYNRWQRCCPGERSPKYQKTYDQCLDLFTSLRKSGVLVHQWW